MTKDDALQEVLRVLRNRQKANEEDLRVKPNRPDEVQLAQWFGMFHAYKEAADMLDCVINAQAEPVDPREALEISEHKDFLRVAINQRLKD